MPTATAIAAVLMKKVVRTTLVSGNRSKLRKFVCQSGAATGCASLFFVRDSILVRGQKGEQAEPAFLGLAEGYTISEFDVLRFQPRQQFSLELRNAQRARHGRTQPSQAGGKLCANNTANRLAGLHLVEADGRLEFLEQLFHQNPAHTGEIE